MRGQGEVFSTYWLPEIRTLPFSVFGTFLCFLVNDFQSPVGQAVSEAPDTLSSLLSRGKQVFTMAEQHRARRGPLRNINSQARPGDREDLSGEVAAKLSLEGKREETQVQGRANRV